MIRRVFDSFKFRKLILQRNPLTLKKFRRTRNQNVALAQKRVIFPLRLKNDNKIVAYALKVSMHFLPVFP